MAAACDLLEAEIALDRIDAELAVELPPHMRAFAAAYAAGSPAPSAPSVLRRAATLRAIEMGRMHPVLGDRALAIARLAWPIVIEDDVAAARGVSPTWAAWEALTAARDAAARTRFGLGFFALMHRLYGVERAPVEVPWPPPVEGWHAREALAEPARPAGRIDVVVSGERGRTFVVEPRRHVIVVAPPVTTPATAFARLHEYGHAIVALEVGLVPRVVDEAAASYAARSLAHPLEAAARARRLQLATALDAIERGVSSARPTPHVPWALWHDPGAQAVYVEAEAIADRWCEPLAGAIAAERARIDAATSL